MYLKCDSITVDGYDGLAMDVYGYGDDVADMMIMMRM